MLLRRSENLWSSPCGQPYMIVVSTSASMDREGKLVMDSTSAAQANGIYPNLAKSCAKAIKKEHPHFDLDGFYEDYGFLEVIPPPHGIGIFQTRHHWAGPNRLATIKRSAEMLSVYAKINPFVQIRLSFPGTKSKRWSNDEQLQENDVLDALACLPDNVTVIKWR